MNQLYMKDAFILVTGGGGGFMGVTFLHECTSAGCLNSQTIVTMLLFNNIGTIWHLQQLKGFN